MTRSTTWTGPPARRAHYDPGMSQAQPGVPQTGLQAGPQPELPTQPPTEPATLPLAAAFPTPSHGQWSGLVDEVARKARRIPAEAPPGAGEDALSWTTIDGIRVRPLYTADDVGPQDLAATGVPGAPPFVRGARATGPVPTGWDVRQPHREPDPEAAAAAITSDLANGVTSIWLALGDGATAVGDLGSVLAGVHLDLAPVVLDAGPAAVPAAEAFLATADARGIAAEALLGTLGLDPIGQRAATGSGADPGSVVPVSARVAQRYPQLRTVVVDALGVHAAGASDAQELGYALAAGVAYLRELLGAGLELAVAARLLEFRFAATADQFATIAKLRAGRRLWSRVTEVCGSAQPQFQHAVGSPTMLTRRDPYVNLVRGTLAGFAAGVGGADAVTVPPFDAAIGAPQPFSRRIARNTQALLTDESHLARVLDPAGGSWYVESRTASIARVAWAFFQEIEAAGGAVAALDSGLLGARIEVVRARRERDIATRRSPLTGVSEFPDLEERPVLRAARPAPATCGLPTYRPAAPFEELRDRSDAQLAATGARPRAFLATLGALADHTARAGFARNLLQAGGIEVVDAGPTRTVDDVTSAFVAAATPVAVLCGTDRLYTERAEATVAALRAVGAGHILLAGTVEVAGLDGHLAAGGDAPAAIEGVYAALAGAAEVTR